MAVCGADDGDREARWWRGRAAVLPADDGRRVGRGSRRRCVAPRVGLAVAVTAERGERGGVDDSGRRIAATCRGRDECGGGWTPVEGGPLLWRFRPAASLTSPFRPPRD